LIQILVSIDVVGVVELDGDGDGDVAVVSCGGRA